MGLFIGDNAPSKIFVGDAPISKVFVGDTQVRPAFVTESIVYKMNADGSGNLYVPVGGYSHYGGISCPYDWNISVDGGASTNYSGTGSSGGSITLSGYTAGSSHTIAITPTTEDYGWALAYGWKDTAGATYLTKIVYDGSYMGYGESATSTGNYFRYYQYHNCTLLTSAPSEILPSSVTSIGSSFRRNQYSKCSSLTTAPTEVLLDTITSIGAAFRNNQYYQCTSLTTISGWKDLSIGNSYYRMQQFYGCTTQKTVKVLSDVGYASYHANALQNSYVTTVSVPSAYLSNFTGASVQPRSSIDDSKFVGY